jgi:hypothetical protein
MHYMQKASKSTCAPPLGLPLLVDILRTLVLDPAKMMIRLGDSPCEYNKACTSALRQWTFTTTLAPLQFAAVF